MKVDFFPILVLPYSEVPFVSVLWIAVSLSAMMELVFCFVEVINAQGPREAPD